jgi:hypothetical protein
MKIIFLIDQYNCVFGYDPESKKGSDDMFDIYELDNGGHLRQNEADILYISGCEPATYEQYSTLMGVLEKEGYDPLAMDINWQPDSGAQLQMF